MNDLARVSVREDSANLILVILQLGDRKTGIIKRAKQTGIL